MIKSYKALQTAIVNLEMSKQLNIITDQVYLIQDYIASKFTSYFEETSTWKTFNTNIAVTNSEDVEVTNTLTNVFGGIKLNVVITPSEGISAEYTTSLTGDDNDLVFTAIEKGIAGNSITVAYVDPLTNDQTLSIVVTDSDIVVNLATDGTGTITSTATEIKAALEVNASALITVALAHDNTGEGIVTAMAETALSGGTGGTIPAGYTCDVTLTKNGATVDTATYTNASTISAPYNFDIILNRPFNHDTLTLVHTFPTATDSGYTVASIVIDDVTNTALNTYKKITSSEKYIKTITPVVTITAI